MSKIYDLKSLIKLSIESNDLTKLEILLTAETNLQQLQNYKYFDVYVYAIKSNHLNLIKYFNSKGFPINCSFNNTNNNKRKFSDDKKDDILETTEYSNALIEAIKCLNIEAVNLLIELNVNLNSTDYKHVPLQIAYNLYQKCKSNEEFAKLKVSFLSKLLKLLT
jgi:hypothetical protein